MAIRLEPFRTSGFLQGLILFHIIFLIMYFPTIFLSFWMQRDDIEPLSGLWFYFTFPVFLLLEVARVTFGLVGNLSDAVPYLSAFVILSVSLNAFGGLTYGYLMPWRTDYDRVAAQIYLANMLIQIIAGFKQTASLIERNTVMFFLDIPAGQLY